MPSPALRARIRRVVAPSLIASALAFGGIAAASGAHADELPQPTATAPTAAPSAAPKSAVAPHAGKPTNAPSGTVKVFGTKVPPPPEKATTDDEVMAWIIKHGTDADRHDIARNLGVAYPSDVSIFGTTCDKGRGYIGVWVINFSAKSARWNVTLDGRGYAGAIVLPRSVDTGAIGVPDGKHTVAFVNPSTGAVAARITTSLHCAATGPVVTKPAHPTKPAPAKPVPVKPAPVKRAPATPSHHVKASHHAVAPTKHAPVAPTTGMGPKVQADFVPVPAASGVSTPLAALLLSAVGGSLLLARRFMRV